MRSITWLALVSGTGTLLLCLLALGLTVVAMNFQGTWFGGTPAQLTKQVPVAYICFLLTPFSWLAVTLSGGITGLLCSSALGLELRSLHARRVHGELDSGS